MRNDFFIHSVVTYCAAGIFDSGLYLANCRFCLAGGKF